LQIRQKLTTITKKLAQISKNHNQKRKVSNENDLEEMKKFENE
jgi:hypothetical protein